MEEIEDIPHEAFQYICRICLAYDNILYAIEDVEMEEGRLREILVSLYLFQLEEIPGLPQNICRDCTIKIYDIHRFFNRCKTTQKFLRHKCSQVLVTESNEDTATTASLSTNTEKNISVEQHDENVNISCQNIQSNILNKTIDVIEGFVGIDNQCEEIKFDGNFIIEERTKKMHNSVQLYDGNLIADYDIKSSDDNRELDELSNDKLSTENMRQSDGMLAVNGSEKLDIIGLVNKLQRIKDEIISIRNTVPPSKLTTQKQKILSTSSTIRRIRMSGPPFVCLKCNESFDIFSSLRKHWQIYNHHPRNFKCPYCTGKYLSSNSKLQQHIRTHTGERPNVCNICDKSFNHKSNYRRHMFIHSESKRYSCTECNRGFNRLEFLRDHQRKHHSGEKLLCPFCGKEFTSYSYLKMHEREQHNTRKPEIRMDENIPYQCKVCGKILASEVVLKDHISSHFKKKRKKTENNEESDKLHKERKDPACEHCQFVFKNAYELHQHRLNSSCSQFVPRMNCPQCGKIFITYGALYAHLRVHKDEGEKNLYECKMCNEQFYKERQYKDHVKRHTRERRFICATCGQAFFVKRHLENHMRTHTGERPFVCTVCEKAFALKVNLTVHMRLHSNIKPYKCCICSHDFRDISSLRKHSKRYHNVDVTVELQDT